MNTVTAAISCIYKHKLTAASAMACAVLALVAGCPTAGGGGGGGDECGAGNPCAEDGVFCNGIETCEAGKCESPGNPCGADEECNEDSDECVAIGPQAFQDADAVRGGSLYDKWWVVAAVDEPTGDHALYPAEGEQAGSGTWRCKECHGWDYKGADGAYASGSHFTGVAGIFGTTMNAQGVFDSIKTTHGFGAAGLTDDDIWDLAKFVLGEGQFNTDDIIGADNMFTGTAATGQTLYDSGIEGNAACALAACHGSDGQAIEFHEDEFLGELAVGNPWEFQHKVRFGSPGTAMPASLDVEATNQDVADVGAYAQTLVAPTTGGDAAAGEAFYAANACAVCHCADAVGECFPGAPSLVGEDSDSIFSRLSGAETHTGPPVADVTQQDADDLAAWLAGL